MIITTMTTATNNDPYPLPFPWSTDFVELCDDEVLALPGDTICPCENGFWPLIEGDAIQCLVCGEEE